MPISSLPDSTLLAITSTLVLNDAASVVKELVDNALDAKATTIAIELSVNTLDVIQVKDNGTGIGVEDRQLICKRGCTSKITTIEDLERLGGSSLGFRGEALASVVDLSDSVTLTTRVDGETAGSILKYGPAGGILSCSSASHPVGSTVRIKDFLKSIPVRKQTALKNASKTLSAIKTLLQSYAFARGTVRFSLKVLKSKNDKANWQYSPVDHADSLREAAVKIIGKDAAGRCEIRLKAADGSGKADLKSEEYSLVTLLAIVNEDAFKLNNTGYFVSIDGRPVSAERGTIKEVVKLYRRYVRNCARNTLEMPASFDPLLVMHITCPRGSYDVNVEPAKDEVMFIDPEAVLALVESIFRDYYGEILQAATKAPPSNTTSDISRPTSAFGLLLAKRPLPPIELAGTLHNTSPIAASSSSIGHGFNHSQNTDSALLKTPELNQIAALSRREYSEKGLDQDFGTSVRSNMYGVDEDEDDLPPPSPSPSILADDAVEGRNDGSRNPWSLAKVNAPIRQPPNMCGDSSCSTGELPTSPIRTQEAQRIPQTTAQSSTHRHPLGLRQQLPSPVTSPHSSELFQNPGPSNQPWAARQRREENLELESHHDMVPTTPSLQGHELVARPLGSWVKPIRPRTELPSFQRVSDIYDKHGRFEEARDGNVSEIPLSQRQPALPQTPSSMDDQSHTQRIGHPFRSPLLRGPDDGASNSGPRSNISQAASGSQQPPLKLLRSQNPELDQIMEFEQRKKAANAQQRKGFNKATGRGLSIAKLAQLQQSTLVNTDELVRREHVQAFQDHSSGVEAADSVAAFGSRFGDQYEGSQALQASNPHRNRYLAAAKSLTRSKLSRRDDSLDSDGLLPEAAEIIGGRATPTSMAENDPRAYLMRQQFQTDSTNAGGLTKTSLKIRRTKTLRLPLESVPAGMVVHDLVAPIDFDVPAYAEEDPGADKYSTTGRNEFIRWTSSMTGVVAWQVELTTLVEAMFRARVGNDLMPPNIQLDLRRKIKTHCDNI